jgi:predicted Zn-dependent protease
LAIVLETQAPGAGQAAGGIGQLFLNHYTQTQERAADEVGIRYAYGAGYDPRAAVDVQERLAVQVPQSMSAGYFDTHPSSVERAVAAREEARELLAQGEPPGRSEALALERSDQRLAPAPRSRAKGASSPSSFGASSPTARAAAPDPVGAADTEDCRRAAVYAEMARDARDPEERQQLVRRAARYCPSPGPLDRY